MESAEGATLPSDLVVSSSEPGTISATAGSGKHRVVVAATRSGSAYLEVDRKGQTYDRVRFAAEPATSVELNKPARTVLAGATLALKLGEVYGACGKECPLIGGGFLKWSALPAQNLAIISDRERTATFQAGKTPGAVTLRGREPVSGRSLVEHTVQVVPTAEVVKLSAETMVALPRQEGQELKVLDPAPSPLTVAPGSLMLVRVLAQTKGGQKVPVWGRDITWTIEGSKSVVKPYDMKGDPDPAEGPIFLAVSDGKAALVGTVAMLGKTVRVDLTVKQSH